MKKFLLSLLCLLGITSLALAETYTKVTDASTLKDGDEVLIVAAESNYAMAPVSSTGNNQPSVEITKSTDGKSIENPTGVQVVTLKESTVSGKWLLSVGEDSYLYCPETKDKNYLKVKSASTAGNKAIATIEISSTSTTIKFGYGSTFTRVDLEFNSNNNPKIFSCYSSGQEAISIYRLEAGDPGKETVATPTFSLEDGEVNVNSTLTISCATADAAIYYTTDGTSPSNESTLYNGPITLSSAGEVVVNAIAVKDGMNDSGVATINLVVVDPTVTRYVCKVDLTAAATFSDTYGKDKTVTWKASNGKVFSTSAVVSGSNTYPAYVVKDATLRLYRLSNNIITVEAPDGFYFESVVAYSSDAEVVTFTVGENGTDVTPDATTHAAEYVFGHNQITNTFSFDVNNCTTETSSLRNCNFSQFVLTINKLSALADQDIALVDGKQFVNTENRTVKSISYAREFTNLDVWKPWYAPFEIDAAQFEKVIELSDAVFEEAVMGESILEFTTVTGTLSANKPYIVKVKNASENFTATSTTLSAAANGQSDDFEGFHLTGIYATKDNMSGVYALASDGNFHPGSDKATLKPFRFFLTVPSMAAGMPMRILVDGEEDQLGIASIFTTIEQGVIYNLQGMPVENPTPGIYIQNGKKILVK